MLSTIEIPVQTTDLDILKYELIHLEEPFRLRPKGTDWFEAQGIVYGDKGGGLLLNDYALVIQPP